MNLKDLRSLCTRWKKKLRLQDWSVSIRWMTAEEQNDTHVNANGFISWNAQHKIADMVLSKTAENLKRTVVHELLHLLWEGNLENGAVLTGNKVQKEIAINTLSELLVP